jgi:hypothetical protein
MKILFDQGTPLPLAKVLSGHVIETAGDLGWSQLENGDLLLAAEQAGFELFISTDQNLKYQQNVSGRRLAIVIRLSTSWPKMQPHLRRIQQVVDGAAAGDYTEIPI